MLGMKRKEQADKIPAMVLDSLSYSLVEDCCHCLENVEIFCGSAWLIVRWCPHSYRMYLVLIKKQTCFNSLWVGITKEQISQSMQRWLGYRSKLPKEDLEATAQYGCLCTWVVCLSYGPLADTRTPEETDTEVSKVEARVANEIINCWSLHWSKLTRNVDSEEIDILLLLPPKWIPQPLLAPRR